MIRHKQHQKRRWLWKKYWRRIYWKSFYNNVYMERSNRRKYAGAVIRNDSRKNLQNPSQHQIRQMTCFLLSMVNIQCLKHHTMETIMIRWGGSIWRHRLFRNWYSFTKIHFYKCWKENMSQRLVYCELLTTKWS